MEAKFFLDRAPNLAGLNCHGGHQNRSPPPSAFLELSASGKQQLTHGFGDDRNQVFRPVFSKAMQATINSD